MYIYFFIIFLIGTYIIFFTPFFISNLLYNYKFKKIQLEYFVNRNNKVYKTEVCFNHSKNDGKLAYYKIKNGYISLKFKQTDKKYDNLYNDYQLVYSNKKKREYTSFSYAVLNILNKILYNTKKPINVAILISLRDKEKDIFKEGNFIKYAFYKVSPNMSSDSILKLHNIKVKTVKNNKNNLHHVTFFDVFKLLKSDIIINSWRDLSNIDIKNMTLTRFEENKLSKDNIEDIYNLKVKRNVVFLDYYNDNWVISKCENIL